MNKVFLYTVVFTAMTISQRSESAAAGHLPLVSGHPEYEHGLNGRRPCQRPFIKKVQDEMDGLEANQGGQTIVYQAGQKHFLSMSPGTDEEGDPVLRYTAYAENSLNSINSE